MIDPQEYMSFMRSRIPLAKPASGGKMINCRCFYCSDSKDPKKGHFYISVPQTVEDIPWYYCHKCHCHGYVTQRKLMEWGIYDEKFAIAITYHNKIAFSSPKNKSFNDREIYSIFNYVNAEREINTKKLKSFNDRLGINVDYDECVRMKVILSLKDLLIHNNITQFTRDSRIVEQLDAGFLGFLSIDNAFVNLRRLCSSGLLYKSIDKRYVNYSVFDKLDNTQRFYTIPTTVNINQPRAIRLNIAEGAFDILSVYYNLMDRQDGMIYTSVGGSNYKSILRYFISTLAIPWMEVHIYRDNDKYGDDDLMYEIKDLLYYFNMPLYVHTNIKEGEKDFGVTRDRIIETVQRVN